MNKIDELLETKKQYNVVMQRLFMVIEEYNNINQKLLNPLKEYSFLENLLFNRDELKIEMEDLEEEINKEQENENRKLE